MFECFSLMCFFSFFKKCPNVRGEILELEDKIEINELFLVQRGLQRIRFIFEIELKGLTSFKQSVK